MPKQSQMRLKREAFHRNIRRQELQNIFTNIRTHLQRNEQLETEEVQRVNGVIDRLPASLLELVATVDEDLNTTCQVVVSRVEEVAERMVRVEAGQWGYYVYILCRVLVAPLATTQFERIVSHTLLQVLQCAEVLFQRNKSNDYLRERIVLETLEYCYRSGKYLSRMDRLQLSALITAVTRIWLFEVPLDEQKKLLCLCNSILAAHFDAEEAENISPQREADLELLKQDFINGVFYCNPQVLRVLMRRCMEYVLVGENQQALCLGIRVLVNITVYVSKPSYYYPLLHSNALHLINSCLLHLLNNEITCLILRLLNNMLVNQPHLTQAILRDIHFPALLNVYASHPHDLAVQGEVAGLLINLLHFLNDDQLFVRQLVNRGVHSLILDYISNYKELEEGVVSQALSALFIANDHHPIQLRQAVRHYAPMLRGLADVTDNAGVVEEILKLVDQQEQHV